MRLTSIITPYNPEWPKRFDEEAGRIRAIIGPNLREIHHIGSTAIAGLSAKPEIDILIVVNGLRDVPAWSIQFSHLGYLRGNDLSPGHVFFRRNVNGVRTHKVHICIEGHVKIMEMLVFRDLLRSDPDLRIRYEELKLKLAAENPGGIGEYLDGKAPFIRAALDKAAAGASGNRS